MPKNLKLKNKALKLFLKESIRKWKGKQKENAINRMLIKNKRGDIRHLKENWYICSYETKIH